MTDVLLIEIGPHGLIWIEPIWKEHSSFEAIRSAYAVIANSDFIGEPLSVRPRLTSIPLGRFEIVA